MFTILMFPKGAELTKIEQIRSLYDPLASLIPAHITLVFPQEYDCIERVIEQINDLTITPFQVIPAGFTASFEEKSNYLFLRFKEDEQIHFLHDLLYQKIVGSVPTIPYTPHLTVGCFTKEEDCEKVLQALKDVSLTSPLYLDELSIERIESNGASTILFHKKLV